MQFCLLQIRSPNSSGVFNKSPNLYEISSNLFQTIVWPSATVGAKNTRHHSELSPALRKNKKEAGALSLAERTGTLSRCERTGALRVVSGGCGRLEPFRKKRDPDS